METAQATHICGVEGCDRPRWAHGLCAPHNKRRVAGKPVDGPIRHKPSLAEAADPVALFWSHVDRSAGPAACWPWTGYVAKNGYGHAAYRLGRKPRDRSHRIAYLITHGDLPKGFGAGNPVIMHACDNRLCCNPAHLRLGTQRENILDARTKGRMGDPPDNSALLRKLTPAVRSEIAALSAQGLRRAAIARRTGLGWTTVDRALGGGAR